MQRIITESILSDQELTSLNGKIIFKWLSKSCGAYYKEPTEAVKLPEGVDKYEVVTGEKKQEYLNQWLDALKKVDDKANVLEKWSGTRLKNNLSELPKSKGYIPPSPEDVVLRELHIQWLRENIDPLTQKPLPGYLSEQEWLKTNR